MEIWSINPYFYVLSLIFHTVLCMFSPAAFLVFLFYLLTLLDFEKLDSY